ncbi:PQQ-binding-like beta-propeller repeat protein [Streptomyces sp. NPDC002888]|uniref:protein kinase domain-containing protein n=1 Tax=Streptomyces sp. NPDC002888 TaxID=3364668 RepID=UPI00368C3127
MPLGREDPRTIGGYTLTDRLGAGGMGVVYRGSSRSGRQVAVKVVHAQYADDPEFRTRFRQEIAAIRKVSGAFTAPVVDADPDAPRPWMATQFVPGPTLADRVGDEGPLAGVELARLALGLVEALHEVHRAGVVHRDLKPGNVLMASDGPRVIDFGISRAAENQPLTETGHVIGTPPFMSPEQLRDSRSVGPASDVFSLAATLVYAATGHGPFDADGPYMTAQRVLNEQPDLTGLDAPLRAVVSRCLSKSPDDRPRLDALARLFEPLAEERPGGATLSPGRTTRAASRETDSALEESDFASAGRGAVPAGLDGGSAGVGGDSAGAGGESAGVGAVPAASGGESAGQGAVPAASGGESAGQGAVPAASGGESAGPGGVSADSDTASAVRDVAAAERDVAIAPVGLPPAPPDLASLSSSPTSGVPNPSRTAPDAAPSAADSPSAALRPGREEPFAVGDAPDHAGRSAAWAAGEVPAATWRPGREEPFPAGDAPDHAGRSAAWAAGEVPAATWRPGREEPFPAGDAPDHAELSLAPAAADPPPSAAGPPPSAADPSPAVSRPAPAALDPAPAAPDPAPAASDPAPEPSAGPTASSYTSGWSRWRRYPVAAAAAVAGAVVLASAVYLSVPEGDRAGGKAGPSPSASARRDVLPAGWRPWETSLYERTAAGQKAVGSRDDDRGSATDCALHDGSVYCGGENIRPVRIDAATGKTLWRSVPLAPDGVDYAAHVIGARSDAVLVEVTASNLLGEEGDEKSVVALDPRTGTRHWKHLVFNDMFSVVTLSGDLVVARTGDGDKVTAWAADTGTERWTTTVPADAYCLIYPNAATLYVLCDPNEDEKLPALGFVLDRKDGTPRSLGTLPATDLLGTHKGRLVFTRWRMEDGSAGTRGGWDDTGVHTHVVLSDPDDGSETTVKLAHQAVGQPTLLDGTLYFVPADGVVTAVSPETGRHLWTVRTGEEMLQPVLSPDRRTLYLVGASGRVLALDPRTGGRRWQSAARAPDGDLWWLYRPVLFNGRALIVDTPDGTLFTLDPAHPDRTRS